ncbi:aldo/keto reductase [Streptomyces sp. NPDC051940]|uniref:aldo/keto reductase n=1 Tax=Streptomyces sp. NPDC051940 TaxID=3155675 RepID=UPI0034419050
MQTRTLGRSNIAVSAVGFGSWAIGGEFFTPDGDAVGWGKVDDAESVRAVHRALDLGITFFDTADVYGAGHSETVLGEALQGRRDEVVIATKFGNTFDAGRQLITGPDATAAYARRALEGSLRRLRTDVIDLWQLHIAEASPTDAEPLRDLCEEFVREGRIRAYAWSTDDPERAALFAAGEHCAAVQHRLNIVEDAPEMLALCARENLASVNRSPLAMGLLSGRFTADTALPAGDVRGVPSAWNDYFPDGRPNPAWLARVDALRDLLTSDGRTLAQGALAWIWARSPHTVPIPGIRTVAQAEENAGAMAFGPLRPEQLAEADRLLAAPAAG